MNEQNQRDSIMSMARGAFEERVDYEMDKVIQNILDPQHEGHGQAQDHPHHRADPGRRAPHHWRLRDGQVYARSHQPRRHGSLCHL